MATWSQDPGQKYLNNGGNFSSTHHTDTYPFISPKNLNLEGKYVLITGASRGVGYATAISFAQAGASGIALGARSSLTSVESAIKTAAHAAGRAEPKLISVNLDVTDLQSVQGAASTISAAFNGKLDVLINNAGHLSSFKPLAETDPEQWWKDYEVNVKGTYYMCRTFIPLLSSHTTGLKTILNISSVGAHNILPGGSAYETAKLAILRFSEFVNTDHGADEKGGILCFAAHPGGVKTELAVGMPEAMHQFLEDEPRLAGDSLVWLVAERREWLRGRYVSANWDMEDLEGRKDEIVKGDLLRVRLAVNQYPEA